MQVVFSAPSWRDPVLAQPAQGRVRGFECHAAYSVRRRAERPLRPWVVLLTLLAVLFAGPRLARAEAKPIQVLTLASDTGFEHAKALTTALERAVDHSAAYTLLPGEYSLEVLTAALNCPEIPDSRCLRQMAARMRTDRFIWGTLEVSGGRVLAHLRYWYEGSIREEHQLEYTSNLADPSDDTLLDLAEDAFNVLVGNTSGQLIVTAGTDGGQVFIDGQLQAALQNGRTRLSVRAGEVRVEVRVPGYPAASTKVRIRPGAETRISIPLHDAQEHRANGPARTRHRLSSMQKAGIAALGIGGLSLGTSVGLVITAGTQRNSSDLQTLKDRLGASDPCQAARKVTPEMVGQRFADDPGLPGRVDDQCDQIHALEGLAWASGVTGGALVLAGTTLLVVGRNRSRPATARAHQLAFSPGVWVAPRAALVDLRVEF